MTPLAWYLRRAIPWTGLLGCCAAAVATAGLLARWPAGALVLLPALVACCAAAAAFCFDERSLAVVEVTPRGVSWRTSARLSVAALPLALWTVLVWWRPGDLPLARSSWWLVGAAATLTGVGLAALASRRAVSAPGGSLASGLVLAALAPVVVAAFLGLDTIYPVGEFPAGVRVLWLGIGAAGLLAAALALRPGMRR